MYLISISNINAAYLFVDYMTTKRITIRLEARENNQADLYLDDETHADMVQQELMAFVNNPQDKRYQEASWQVGRAHIQQSLSKSLFNLVKVGPVTLLIAIISVILFVAERIWGPWILLNYLGFPVNSDYYGELWRWITPIFLHFSLLHILFNLSWWWYLGGMIEKQLGKMKLLEITIISGVISNYSEALLMSPNFGGLSGVVYALMGYAWLSGECRPQRGIYLERSMLFISIIWLVAGFLGYLGPIANFAHLSGLVIGLVIAAKDILFKLK